MRHFALLVSIQTFIAFAPVNAHAQELRPLNDLLDTAARAYPFQRCAGMYQAVGEWAGEKRLGSETFNTMKQSIDLLLTASTLISMNEGMTGSTEHVYEMTLRDVRNIADLYIRRFEANYSAQGEIFWSDDLVKSDLTTCKRISELTSQSLK